jgi:hypothetical protein
MTVEVDPWVVQAGEPFSRVIRLVDGATIWPTVGDFEVRAQVREENTMPSKLIFDLSPHFVTSVDGVDLVATLVLNGQQTRQLKDGYYDVFFSDVGGDDSKAVRAFKGTISWVPAYTSAV